VWIDCLLIGQQKILKKVGFVYLWPMPLLFGLARAWPGGLGKGQGRVSDWGSI